MTAAGILSRMSLGWTADHNAVQRAVEKIAQQGPERVDLYYNYYATQVVRHYGGKVWEKWNQRMRDALVQRQSRDGHKAGSWLFTTDSTAHNDKGGRLYQTVMATLLLESYYRHLPLGDVQVP